MKSNFTDELAIFGAILQAKDLYGLTKLYDTKTLILEPVEVKDKTYVAFASVTGECLIIGV